MIKHHQPGLGELLRHLSDLVDKGSEINYKHHKLSYRPRYTPVLRVLSSGLTSVSEITHSLQITQGAVSQTIKLMADDGLIVKQQGKKDGRETAIILTKTGKALVKQLESHWCARFEAIENLAQETGIAIEQNLLTLIGALEYKDFSQRIDEARSK